MSKAMLIDLNRCIGCRACQAVCKCSNDLPAQATRNTGSYQNPPRLSACTHTIVSFDEREEAGRMTWVFTKRQCMHCEHPACASACTVGALQKTAEGPVVYDAKKCFGCRYCQYACPFQVPGFQWGATLGLIGKCDMCADRQALGLEPACAKTCPTGAISFGDRSSLLQEARRRIATSAGKYVNHIYGENEAGGTSVLYLSPVPFADLGFPTLGKEPISRYAEAVMNLTPVTAISVAALASGLYWIIKRRDEMMQQAVHIAAQEGMAAPPPPSTSIEQDEGQEEVQL